jgi:excisionase family DNA binding protein
VADHDSQQMFDGEKLWTVAEAAELLRISNMTVYRLIHAAQLKAYRVRGSIRVPESAIQAYLKGSVAPVDNHVVTEPS